MKRKGSISENPNTFTHKFKSLIEFILFIPKFSLFVCSYAIWAFFFKSGKGFFKIFLASYILFRLIIGFILLIFFKICRRITELILSFIDFTFRTKDENNLLDNFKNSNTYDEWLHYGKQLDKLSENISEFINNPISNDYDYELLKLQLSNLKNVLRSSDIENMMQSVSNVFRRTFCSLQNPRLYSRTYTGQTKLIIDEYYNKLAQILNIITSSENIQEKQEEFNNDIEGVQGTEENEEQEIEFDDNLSSVSSLGNVNIKDKLDFLYRCKKSLGRTALCLSGGGSLAMAHVGVIRALIKENLLPKVISGTSGGAIIAGYLGTLSDSELFDEELDKNFGYTLANKFGVKFLPNFYKQLSFMYKNKVLMDANDFIKSIKKYVGNLTFREAWLKTGRHVSISVSYSTKGSKNNKSSIAHSIILNHITSPDVYLWSAITASCALPGLMIPQMLYSKNNKSIDPNNNANDIPYYPDGIKWLDGSLQSDIPIKQLQEIFRVNYFIVSQVNPHVVPFLTNNMNMHTLSSNLKNNNFLNRDFNNINKNTNNFFIQLLSLLDDLANETVNHQLNRLVKLKSIPAVYGQNFDKFARQTFSGDITIIPKFDLSMRFKLLTHPSQEDMLQYINIGERYTWPYIQQIKHILKIEKLIDINILKLKYINSKFDYNLINNINSTTQSSYYNIKNIKNIKNKRGKNINNKFNKIKNNIKNQIDDLSSNSSNSDNQSQSDE